MDFDLRKSGQIPAFGNWDSSNDMPITQYFESARQAGLVRYSASSGVDCNKCPNNNKLNNNRNYGHEVHYGGGDLYAAVMPLSRGFYVPAPPHPKVKAMNRRHQKVERKRMVMKVRDVRDIENQYKNQQLKPKKAKSRQQFPNKDKNSQNIAEHVEELRLATIIVKPVDEDLYKIPPDLIHKSERTWDVELA
ncbi:hypothetical protein LIER_36221 [Lithospermum erythrorhizon]|uniref:Uncharacterized protein n=1 Tax=Lithospermum erythrorhizon TaxID=34254 RepID=A0AAV3P2V1_LITER